MPSKMHYVQECPICGRNLQVRVEYLGKQVVCQHCGGQFQACEPNSAAYPPGDSSLALLRRANELLQASLSGVSVEQEVATSSRSAE